MGLSKTELFSAAQNQRAAYAKLLAHPARIAILEYLLRSEQCCNSQLTQELGLAQATVSQHLKELKQSGLIQGTVEGVSINYCLNPAQWQDLRQALLALLDQDPQSAVQCC